MQGKHSVGTHPIDELNRKAYAWRYRDIDTAAYYANKAYAESERYKHGRSVACNILGFVAFQQMDYESALQWYDEVDILSGCELERLVADVGRMNVFQRTAENLSFYDCRVRATKRLDHINEEIDNFHPLERYRLQSTVNDMHMVTALHHYMMGQQPEAHAEMVAIKVDDALRADTSQWLMYNYLKGLGVNVEGDTYEQRLLRCYSYLNTCLLTAQKGGFNYFTGHALFGMSQLLADSARTAYIANQRPNSFSIYEDSSSMNVGVSMSLVTNAITALESYGDCYGVANAKVQMASLYNRKGEYTIAIDTLQRVLNHIASTYSESYLLSDSVAELSLFDTANGEFTELEWISTSNGRTIPDVLCRLREEASFAFSGLSNKMASDYNRNIYLDLLEMTRQDKELESRYLSLKRQQHSTNILLSVTLLGVFILVILIIVIRKRRRNGDGYEQHLRDLLKETEKRVYLHQRHIESSKRDNIRRKASLSIVTGIMPYIDRISHEVERLQTSQVWDDISLRNRKLEYVAELTDEINSLNEILAQWIKTTQGIVHLHIESFPLAEVFAILRQSESSFMHKGLTLDVRQTEAVVKADKALTFFMLNTLADNARKFTPSGGKVTIEAQECEDYIELSVCDTGVGMCDNDIHRILHEKVYDATSIGESLPVAQRMNKGGGFGLLNCKGIIDKYRKTDSFFEVCSMGIDSKVGKGSRFWFRLPKGLCRTLALVCMMLVSSISIYGNETNDYDPLLQQASAFADSVYFANVDGRYSDALQYADSAILYLNAHHRKYADEYIDTLTATRGPGDVETRWWLSDFATDYHTILDIRNELAMAHLALRRWDDYRYNNRIYNELYKLISEDRSLVEYCNRMQRYNNNIYVAIIICIILVVGYLIIILYAFMGRVDATYRDIESVEDDERRVQHEKNRLHVQNLVLDNCLSTIKHETVYYPSRIRKLVDKLDAKDNLHQISELISYYKVLFTTLLGCASRQLNEVTFRRSSIPAEELLHHAATYHNKLCIRTDEISQLTIHPCDGIVLCDVCLTDFLIEQLIDASLASNSNHQLTLSANADGDFIRFTLSVASSTLTPDEVQTLFYPKPSRINNSLDGHLQGIEYIVARQIIREHDDYFNHIGCRIKAEPTSEGYTLWFTLPRHDK